MIDSLVSSGTIAWVALGVLGLEFLLVSLLWRTRTRLLPFAANALSGAFLILAFHAALTGAGVTPIALWLGLGFIAHLGDTLVRLHR